MNSNTRDGASAQIIHHTEHYTLYNIHNILEQAGAELCQAQHSLSLELAKNK